MDNVSLQFQGVRNQALLVAVLGAIVLVLVAYGIVELRRRRWRRGLCCLAAALGPLGIGPYLAIDAGVHYVIGDRRRARRSALVAMAILAAAAGLGVFVARAADRSSAFWISVLGLEVAIAVGVFYEAVYASLGRQRLAVLTVLRYLSILVLLAILFRPALSISPVIEQAKPYLPIVVDRSASMSTADAGSVRNRYVEAAQMLHSQLGAIERTFRPVYLHFAECAERVDSLDRLAALQPAGQGTDGTDIAAAIRAAVAKRSRANLAGILLLSDGNHNAPSNVSDAVIEAGTAIYPLGVGATGGDVARQCNIRIESLSAPLEAVRNNVTTISVRLQIDALPNVSTDVQLFEEGSETPIAVESVWTDRASQTVTVKLKWTPRDRGPADAEGGAGSARTELRKLRIVAPLQSSEAVAEDNDTELHVLVTEPRIRVLYVEGSMRPEYKFLRRLLDTDPNLQFMGLVRISRNQFLAQGSIAGRQLAGLPTTDEEFDLFDVIILGDLDRTFLTRDQLAKLRRFVNDGGGLVMLGGHNSFGPGGYGGTALQAALPVTTGGRSMPQETTPFIPQLTASGQAHPIFEGIAGYFTGPGGQKPDPKLQALPELLGCVTVEGAKSGAEILAVHPTRRNSSGPLVVLAAQRFGAGRSAAFTADTTWQWYLRLRGLGGDSPYHRFWGQLVRWLANIETKARQATSAVLLRMDRSYVRVGQTVQLTSRVLDSQAQATDLAQVSCVVTDADDPAAAPETIALSPSRAGGVFEASYRPPDAGNYNVKVTALDSAGVPLGTDELALHVAPHSAEMDRLERNEAMLEEIAQRSRGRYADIFALPDIVKQLAERHRSRSAPPGHGQTIRLYNFPLLLVVFVTLLTVEWVLRRRWQLQ